MNLYFRQWALVAVVCVAAAGCRKEEPAENPSAGPAPEAPATVQPIFADVTEQVGLDFYHFIGATGQFYFPEIMGAGCGVFDYDNDGDLDIYAAQGALLNEEQTLDQATFPYRGSGRPHNVLYRNDLDRGRLHFTDVTEGSGVGHTGYGMGCAAADYDNDGFLDLYVTNYGPNVLYRNNGDGTFTDVTAEAGVDDTRWSASAAFADVNGDGLLDLYVANYVDWRLVIDRACYSSTGVRDYCSPVTYKPAGDSLFYQRAGGRFENVTAGTGIDRDKGTGWAWCAPTSTATGGRTFTWPTTAYPTTCGSSARTEHSRIRPCWPEQRSATAACPRRAWASPPRTSTATATWTSS